MPTPPRFFLAEPPARGVARLAADDERHARRVLRLRVGDDAFGLDGQGSVWPLRLAHDERGELRFECTSPPSVEPAPGEQGSRIPWIEVAVSLPRGARADEMLDRLVQLGIAAIRPLGTERTQGFARELSPARTARLVRVAREACKQSRRAWMPEIHADIGVAELANLSPATSCMLTPAATERLAPWIARAPWCTRRGPLRLIVGAEGGLTPDEERDLERAGAQPVTLGPHILRIETAAEAAAAIAVHALFRS